MNRANVSLQQDKATSVLRSRQGVLQRKCACGNKTVAGGECTECAKKKNNLQRKQLIGASNDPLEREADRVADQVLAMPVNSNIVRIPPRIQRLTGQPAGQADSAPASVDRVLSSAGKPLDPVLRKDMEQRFNHDFSGVRVHTGAVAEQSAREVNAHAYTAGHNVVFGEEQFMPGTHEGRRLLAHELTHVVQQSEPERVRLDLNNEKRSLSSVSNGIVSSEHENVNAIQREANISETPEEQENVTGPLTDREWQLVELWLNNGEVGIDPLTEDAHHNSEMVAAAIFCGRILTRLVLDDLGEDPLLCVIPSVTRADHRVQQLVHQVDARGPIINWARVDPNQRMLYVMRLLVSTHGYPVNGAAGLVGNLSAESGVLPNRIEGSRSGSPMRARDFRGRETDFTAEQVMDRNLRLRQGPRRPGIGLAQWTSSNRRAALFQHQFGGRQVGSAILFNMDAQVDFLVTELQTRFPRVNRVLMTGGVSVEAASDEVVLNFETPAAVIAGGRRLPRTDTRVQAVLIRRRRRAQRALQVFNEANRARTVH